jgi:hypothetical protein
MDRCHYLEGNLNMLCGERVSEKYRLRARLRTYCQPDFIEDYRTKHEISRNYRFDSETFTQTCDMRILSQKVGNR